VLGRTTLLCALALFGLPLAACGRDEPSPCLEPIAHVFVDTASHELWLCDGVDANSSFDVRLGVGGTGKTRQGDRKVPLGTYSLAIPRSSPKFGTFIEIGYPTQEQRAKGYTGSAIGIHGPSRNLSWLGRINNWFDTTDGCIGLSSDAEIEHIAEWVRVKAAGRVVIR
jgi:hypothetical protein